MDENKINFLQPSVAPPNFVCSTSLLTSDLTLNSFSLTSRQVPISQIYPTRKIKHPSFRKRASSGTMPYYIPFKHRQRTKSENADGQASHPVEPHHDSSMDCENINDKNLGMETTDEIHLQQISNNLQFNKIKSFQLKKSKSMESLLLKPTSEEQKVNAATNSSTLEFPTLLHRIQKLKFNE